MLAGIGRIKATSTAQQTPPKTARTIAHLKRIAAARAAYLKSGRKGI